MTKVYVFLALVLTLPLFSQKNSKKTNDKDTPKAVETIKAPTNAPTEKTVTPKKELESFNFFQTPSDSKANSIESKKMDSMQARENKAINDKMDSLNSVKSISSDKSKKDTSIMFEIPDAKMPINTGVSNGVPEMEYVGAVAPRELKYKANEKDVNHFEELRVKFSQEQTIAMQKSKDSLAKANAEALKEYNARHTTPMEQTNFEQYRYGERGVPPVKKEVSPQESYNELFK